MLKKPKNLKRLLRNDGKWGARFTKLAIYLLLLDFGFVYIYPVIYMVLVSLMPTSDLINPTIQWIPTYLDFENFKQVYTALVLYISNFPLVTTVVDASKKNGYGSAGAAIAIGLEPIIAKRP